MQRLLAATVLLLCSTPCAHAGVKWVSAPDKLSKVAVAFDAFQHDPDVKRQQEEDVWRGLAFAGEMQGFWFFAGGDVARAPTSYTRLWPEGSSSDVRATFVCEDTAENCQQLRKRAEELAASLDEANLPSPPPPPPPPMAGAPGSDAPPVYPKALREAGVSGTVYLLLSYDKTGKVVNVAVRKSSGHAELDASAMEAAKGWHVNPGTSDGRPLAGDVVVPVEFKLDD